MVRFLRYWSGQIIRSAMAVPAPPTLQLGCPDQNKSPSTGPGLVGF